MTSLPSQGDGQVTMGIDVAKATLEVAISGRPTTLSVANSEAGFAELVREVGSLDVGSHCSRPRVGMRSPALLRCNSRASQSLS
jgi:hypothetical protein